MKLSLNVRILLGAALGLIGGVLLGMHGTETKGAQWFLYGCEIVGGLFIDLLKMILIPLVFTSITVGIANLRAHAQMDRVWKYTLGYFFLTTSLAVILGLIVVNVFKPGVGLEMTLFEDAMANFQMNQMSLPEFVRSFLRNLFLNPLTAMAQGNILPTVLFAMFLGIAMVLAGNKAKVLLGFFSEFFELIMMMVGWIMQIAPFGIMALLIQLVATQDISILFALGKFICVVLGATLFHGLIILPGVLFAVTRISPARFFSALKEALLTALSTSSSSATLPVTMRCVEEKLKVNKDVAGFVLPLGATINMDGTALYEAVAALFVANIVGIELNIIQQLVIFFTAIVAAVGAPGIPSAGMVTMVMVLQSVGLPAEAIAILLPIDRLLDAVRTSVNVQGDAIGSAVVDQLVSSPPKIGSTN
jgi:Na+/H+-dicarboxylate symporter